MEIKQYNGLCDDAMYIRETVFIDEQRFRDEFDEIDKKAVHLVAYDKDKPVATCRFFWSDERNTYLLGRLAVLKEYRKNHLGSVIMTKAEALVRENNGVSIELHAQEQAIKFYEKQGYSVCSDMEYEEYCPHYWMRKKL